MDQTRSLLDSIALYEPNFDPTAWTVDDALTAMTMLDEVDGDDEDDLGRRAAGIASARWWLEYCGDAQIWRGENVDREMILSLFGKALSEMGDPSDKDDFDSDMFADVEYTESFELQRDALAQSPIVSRFAKFLDWYDRHGRPMPGEASVEKLEALYAGLGLTPDGENMMADLKSIAVMWSWVVVSGPEPQERWHDDGDASAMPFDVQFGIVSARISDVIEWEIADDTSSDLSDDEARRLAGQVGLALRALLLAAVVEEPIFIADWEHDVAASDSRLLPAVAAECRKRIEILIAEGVLSVVDGRWTLVPGLKAVVEDAVALDDMFASGVVGDDFLPDD
ncbi:hypothetical protein HH308_03250 [Gordonia sp. TBRC 11910]|uniref:Uncharacterized protein n=1 Tax=Gordonia asplenii TaxID=2725283 RepID=A0A848KXP3_9ACTN|nr:hypothetical protein [Gordonia asplenii]NMO00228.1 hypothetical protein [Gordonia asplenii]